MTVGQILIEAEKLNDEELENLYGAIFNIKCDRDYARKEEAMKKLKDAWDTVVALGITSITVYDNEGKAIKKFDDFEWSY